MKPLTVITESHSVCVCVVIFFCIVFTYRLSVLVLLASRAHASLLLQLTLLLCFLPFMPMPHFRRSSRLSCASWLSCPCLTSVAAHASLVLLASRAHAWLLSQLRLSCASRLSCPCLTSVAAHSSLVLLASHAHASLLSQLTPLLCFSPLLPMPHLCFSPLMPIPNSRLSCADASLVLFISRASLTPLVPHSRLLCLSCLTQASRVPYQPPPPLRFGPCWRHLSSVSNATVTHPNSQDTRHLNYFKTLLKLANVSYSTIHFELLYYVISFHWHLSRNPLAFRIFLTFEGKIHRPW